MSDPLPDAPATIEQADAALHNLNLREWLRRYHADNGRRGGLSRSAKKLKALENNRARSAEKFRLRREAVELRFDD